MVEGYHDLYNMSSSELQSNTSLAIKRKYQGDLHGANRTYEFVFIPNSGFLNSNLPLMTNCELKLSFDRLNASYSMMEYGSITNALESKPLVIKDCVAIAEYVQSDELDNYFGQIQMSPITYYYEDCDVILRSIPKDETSIRIDNIKGGNTPNCIFAAIIPSTNLAGSVSSSTTSFRRNKVTEFNITLNGNSVNGYPMTSSFTAGVVPLQRFMDVTNRYMNISCGEGVNFQRFYYNWIYSHRFEAESSDEGWLGIDIKLSSAYTDAHTLVIWCINDAAITIDKFHQLEKLTI